MVQDGLTDSLPKIDPGFYGPAYNNTTDRLRVELPPAGDMAASGVIGIGFENFDVVNRNATFAGAQTSAPVWLPASGLKAVLMGVSLSSDGTNVIRIHDSLGVDIIPAQYLSAAHSVVTITSNTPIAAPSGFSSTSYYLTSSQATGHSVLMWGYETEL